MKKLTILVDMDGTIERLLDAWLVRLNKRYNRSVTVDDIAVWDIGEAYPGLTPEQIMEDIYGDEIWGEVQPIENAAEVLKQFIDDGHEVYIVTSTPYQSVQAKMDKLLFRYFPFLRWRNVIITSNKQLVAGDVLIDDAIHNLVGGPYQKVLFDALYNRDFDAEANGMIRAHGWLEVKEIIAKMAEE